MNLILIILHNFDISITESSTFKSKIMKTMIAKCTAVMTLLMIFSFGNSVQAQNKNVIKEINLYSNDGFNDLRNLISVNFDYTNPELYAGNFNTMLQFNVDENGELKNVQALGDSRYVNKEVESLVENLMFRVDRNKLSEDVLTTNYIMPVTISISDR